MAVGTAWNDVFVADEVWRPLGFDGAGEGTYDALHDGVPPWMAESFWTWMRMPFMSHVRMNPYGETYEWFNAQVVLDVERVCRIRIGYAGDSPSAGMNAVRHTLTNGGTELRVADFLLTRGAPATGLLDTYCKSPALHRGLASAQASPVWLAASSRACRPCESPCQVLDTHPRARYPPQDGGSPGRLCRGSEQVVVDR